MDLGKILKTVGGAVLKDVIPGGGVASLVIDTVNSFLPGKDKLPDNATGHQAMAAITSLPAEQQAAVLNKQFEVEIAEITGWSSVVDSLAKADAAGSSTRPQIAMIMAWVVAFTVSVSISSWAFAIWFKQDAVVKNIVDSWPFIATVILTPTALLRSYFGMRTDEKKSRYTVASGGTVQAGGMSSILTALTGR